MAVYWQSIPLADAQKEVLLLLAVHREVTMSVMRQVPQQAGAMMVMTCNLCMLAEQIDCCVHYFCVD